MSEPWTVIPELEPWQGEAWRRLLEDPNRRITVSFTDRRAAQRAYDATVRRLTALLQAEDQSP